MAQLLNKVVNGFQNFFGGDAVEGVDDPDDYGLDVPETIDDPVETESKSSFDFFNLKSRNKVVELPQPQQVMMKIAKPTTLDEVYGIMGLLKEKNAVVLNLEYVSKDVARRIVDVISGAVFALDGHFEKVSNSIFVAAPFNYDIVSDNSKDKKESQFAASNFIK